MKKEGAFLKSFLLGRQPEASSYGTLSEDTTTPPKKRKGAKVLAFKPGFEQGPIGLVGLRNFHTGVGGEKVKRKKVQRDLNVGEDWYQEHPHGRPQG